MGDYIERKAALHAINEFFHDPKVDAALYSVPAADVRLVVRGRWIKSRAIVGIDTKTCDVKIGETDKCSECGEEFVRPIKEYKFCPSCGADMREGNEK